MSTIKIVNRFDSSKVLFESNTAQNVRECVVEAIAQVANLSRANLSGADLSRANLSGATGAELTIAKTRILPDEGAIIGWKKCRGDVIVKLLIPAEAKRSHAFGRKCRAERVEVLEVFGAEFGLSMHDATTVYRKGEVVRPDSFSEDWQDECAPGIHFFITRLEAENY
jgi:hypothetical protein